MVRLRYKSNGSGLFTTKPVLSQAHGLVRVEITFTEGAGFGTLVREVETGTALAGYGIHKTLAGAQLAGKKALRELGVLFSDEIRPRKAS